MKKTLKAFRNVLAFIVFLFSVKNLELAIRIFFKEKN